MKYLLDTCVLLYATIDTTKLSKTCKKTLENSNNQLYLSIVSIWEMAIKRSRKRLTLSESTQRFIDNAINDLGIEILQVELSHIFQIEKLPFLHSDPFDRMLISQAKVEDLTILTNDKEIKSYDIHCLW